MKRGGLPLDGDRSVRVEIDGQPYQTGVDLVVGFPDVEHGDVLAVVLLENVVRLPAPCQVRPESVRGVDALAGIAKLFPRARDRLRPVAPRDVRLPSGATGSDEEVPAVLLADRGGLRPVQFRRALDNTGD